MIIKDFSQHMESTQRNSLFKSEVRQKYTPSILSEEGNKEVHDWSDLAVVAVDLYFNFKIFIFLKKAGFAGKPKHIGDYNFLNILIKITIKEKQTHKI